MSEYTVNKDVVLTELEPGAGVLLHLGTKFYYSINGTGMAVWKALSRGVSRDDIAAEIAGTFAVDAHHAARDLEPVLREMLVEGLIVPASSP